MERSKRILIILSMLAVVLILGVIYWPFVLNELIIPIALTAWLMLRIFVLSVDQKIYWGALILGAAVLLFRRLMQSTLMDETETLLEENRLLKDVEFWRSFFKLYSRDKAEQAITKRQLARLVVSMYASKQGITAYFLVAEALRKGEIPLPETVYNFLFADEEEKPAHLGFKQTLQSCWFNLRQWMDDISGRNTVEYYRGIEEVLKFMEFSLEIKSDDEHTRHNSN